jgi:hypothetical protein
MLYKSIIASFALVITLAGTGASPLPSKEHTDLAARDAEIKRTPGVLCDLGLFDTDGIWCDRAIKLAHANAIIAAPLTAKTRKANACPSPINPTAVTTRRKCTASASARSKGKY